MKTAVVISNTLPDLGHVVAPPIDPLIIDPPIIDPPDQSSVMHDVDPPDQSSVMQHNSTLASLAQSISARDAEVALRDAKIIALESEAAAHTLAAASAASATRASAVNHSRLKLLHTAQSAELGRVQAELSKLKEDTMTTAADDRNRALQALQFTEAHVAKIKADRDEMMKLIRAFIALPRDGDFVKSLQSMSSFQKENGISVDSWTVDPAFVSLWSDAQGKIDTNVKYLLNRTTNSNTAAHLDTAAVTIIDELNAWYRHACDPKCTWLLRCVISWLLRGTTLATFVDELENQYIIKRGTKKVDAFVKDTNKQNTISSNWFMQRNIIHICALHCHIRAVLSDKRDPFGVAATSWFIDFTTGIYRLIVDRDIDIDVCILWNAPLQKRININREQRILGQRWLSFVTCFHKTADKDVRCAVNKTLRSRYFYPDQIVAPLRGYIKTAWSINIASAEGKAWFDKAIEQAGMKTNIATSDSAAEWCLKELPTPKISSLLTTFAEKLGGLQQQDIKMLTENIDKERNNLELK